MKKRKQLLGGHNLSHKLYNVMRPIPDVALLAKAPLRLEPQLWNYLALYFKPFNK